MPQINFQIQFKLLLTREGPQFGNSKNEILIERLSFNTSLYVYNTLFFFAAQIHPKGVKSTPESWLTFRFCFIH